MGRNINTTKLTKQYIFSKISQISIFSAYLNLSNNIIQHCINTGELIKSPIREDNHPTCGFKYDNKGKLKFKDFAGFFWGDCFDVVALVMSNIYNKEINISNKNDFIKVLRHITLVFKDIFYGKEKDILLINEINTTIDNIKKTKPKIELVVRNWNTYDEIYWKQFGISIKYLNINFVYPIDQYYINRKINPNPKYYYNKEDPCYGYFLGKDKQGIYNIKLYFPKRNKGNTKFITNCNHLEGIYNLNKTNYNIIIITKSTKDRLSIGNMIYNMISFYGEDKIGNIGVINIPHETYRLRQNEYDWLYKKLNNNGKIVSLMDNDDTGKREAIWLRNNYNIIPLLIPSKYKSKDFSELVNNISINIIHNIIFDSINYINNYERKETFITWNNEKNSSLPY